MMDWLKWKVIDFLIKQRILAPVRVRSNSGRRQYR